MSKTLWNFYVDEAEKLKFMRELVSNGHQNAQAAALRTLMDMYTSGEVDKELFDKKLNKHVIRGTKL
jgi:hypothetical protein